MRGGRIKISSEELFLFLFDPGTVLKNLRSITEMGLEAWIAKGKKIWNWDEAND